MNIFVPSEEDHFWSLLYHALFHKDKIAEDYKDVFRGYLGNKFGVSKPNDPSVPFKLEHLNFNPKDVCYGVTSRVYIEDKRVTKVFYDGYNHCFDSELKALCRLHGNPHFPALISSDYEKQQIIMSNCGQPLSTENLPEDWFKQLAEIADTLKEYDVVHRDITPFNVFVKSDVVILIDFGWSTTFSKKDTKPECMSPGEWQNLGLIWRAKNEFDDRASLEAVLSSCYLQKVGLAVPDVSFTGTRS